MRKTLIKSWIDVSVPLKNGMVHWPGDPPIQIKRVLDMSRGDPCNVSALSMGTHTGTHIDAPFHFFKNGKTLDELPFTSLVGKARVIEIKDKESVKPEELRRWRIRAGERILFKTLNSSRCWKTGKFIKDFVYISKEAAAELSRIKVQTVGIDYLSVGGYSRDGLETHLALLSKGVWIIEGLNLSKVRPGGYELVCLPLRMFRGDGAPARAILKRI